MKLRIAILMASTTLGVAWAQNPSIIDNTKAKLNSVQQQNTAQSNAAAAATQGQSTSTSSTPSGGATKNSGTSADPNGAPAQMEPKRRARKAKSGQPAKTLVAVEDKKVPVDSTKQQPKTINLTGRRDPFISPVITRGPLGSGCATGKRCLAIDQINLNGIVKSDTGMIAVVVNAFNKAYFLRENDPVFNGYVVKITADSVVFKETVQDKLGKPFTREVTKKIMTPAV
jgi:hypothetical protein